MPPKEKKGKEEKELTPLEALELEIAKLDKDIEQLGIQIVIQKDQVQQQMNESAQLEQQIPRLQKQQQETQEQYAQTLQAREDQYKSLDKEVSVVVGEVEALEKILKEKDVALSKLRGETNAIQSRLQAAGVDLNDKEGLEEAFNKQKALLEKQTLEIEKHQEHLKNKEIAVQEKQEELAKIMLQCEGEQYLHILFSDPWLISTSYKQLVGDIPQDREGACLIPTAQGQQLFLFGGQSPAQTGRDPTVRDVWLLNVDSGVWERDTKARAMFSLYNHAGVSIARNKILIFGGYRNGQLTQETVYITTDSLRWTMPVLRSSILPPPVSGHCMCIVREQVYVFGGYTLNGLSNELWMFDNEALTWTQIHSFGAEPSPRKGASIAASENGRRLYVFGGRSETGQHNDLFQFDVERQQWNSVQVTGVLPAARDGHISSINGRCMYIAGGRAAGLGGVIRKAVDMWVLDLQLNTWECIDNGQWANNFIWMKQGGTYQCLQKDGLISLRPKRDEYLHQMMTFTLENSSTTAGPITNSVYLSGTSAEVEILDEAQRTSRSIQVSWKVLGKTMDKIERFKLMYGTKTGLVREVAEGNILSAKVTGLQPGETYIFRVKVINEDGSSSWSASKCFRTIV